MYKNSVLGAFLIQERTYRHTPHTILSWQTSTDSSTRTTYADIHSSLQIKFNIECAYTHRHAHTGWQTDRHTHTHACIYIYIYIYIYILSFPTIFTHTKGLSFLYGELLPVSRQAYLSFKLSFSFSPFSTFSLSFFSRIYPNLYRVQTGFTYRTFQNTIGFGVRGRRRKQVLWVKGTGRG